MGEHNVIGVPGVGKLQVTGRLVGEDLQAVKTTYRLWKTTYRWEDNLRVVEDDLWSRWL